MTIYYWIQWDLMVVYWDLMGFNGSYPAWQTFAELWKDPPFLNG